jgi:hypothetical protein
VRRLSTRLARPPRAPHGPRRGWLLPPRLRRGSPVSSSSPGPFPPSSLAHGWGRLGCLGLDIGPGMNLPEACSPVWSMQHAGRTMQRCALGPACLRIAALGGSCSTLDLALASICLRFAALGGSSSTFAKPRISSLVEGSPWQFQEAALPGLVTCRVPKFCPPANPLAREPGVFRPGEVFRRRYPPWLSGGMMTVLIRSGLSLLAFWPFADLSRSHGVVPRGSLRGGVDAVGMGRPGGQTEGNQGVPPTSPSSPPPPVAIQPAVRLHSAVSRLRQVAQMLEAVLGELTERPRCSFAGSSPGGTGRGGIA